MNTSSPRLSAKESFLKRFTGNKGDVKVQFSTNNLAITQKWTRNALVHIARVLSPHSYCTAFESSNYNFDYLMEETENWDPPSPPRLKLLPTKNAWITPIPPSISGSSKSIPRTKQYKIMNTTGYNSDCNTATTIATQMSVFHNILSKLQSNSQQHHEAIEAQSRRFDILDNQVQTQMDNLLKRCRTLKKNTNLSKYTIKNLVFKLSHCQNRYQR
jgi:hypothetical protein